MINFTPSTQPPKWIRNLLIVTPVFLSVFLCGNIALIGMFPKLGITIQTAYPVLVFLPMAFLFVAVSTQNEVARLEKRIDDMEAKLSDAKKA
jgi:hypothetical protein